MVKCKVFPPLQFCMARTLPLLFVYVYQVYLFVIELYLYCLPLLFVYVCQVYLFITELYLYCLPLLFVYVYQVYLFIIELYLYYLYYHRINKYPLTFPKPKLILRCNYRTCLLPFKKLQGNCMI